MIGLFSIVLLCTMHLHADMHELRNTLNTLCGLCTQQPETDEPIPEDIRDFMTYCTTHHPKSSSQEHRQQEAGFDIEDISMDLDELEQSIDVEQTADTLLLQEIIDMFPQNIHTVFSMEQLRQLYRNDYRALYRDLATVNREYTPYIQEQFRLRALLKNNTRMFPVIPATARTTFGNAVVGKCQLDNRFRKYAKNKAAIARGIFLELEETYYGQAELFLIAYNQGYPAALREATQILTGKEMASIIDWKQKTHNMYQHTELHKVVSAITHHTYYLSDNETPSAAYINMTAAIFDAEKKYLERLKEAHPCADIIYEESCYAIARNLITVHERGHSGALQAAVNLMSNPKLLAILEKKKLHALTEAEKDFSVIWRNIESHKHHTEPIHAQASSSSSSSSSSSTTS